MTDDNVDDDNDDADDDDYDYYYYDSFIGHACHRQDLTSCIETRTVGAQPVLGTRIRTRCFQFANWSSVQFSLCAVNKP